MQIPFKIKHIHADVSTFNGFLYFVVNNKLMIVSVSTPHFNDYGEWRITEITIAKNDYKPEENEVELTPYNIEPIQINEKELKYLQLFFCDHQDIIEDNYPTEEMGKFLKENKGSDYPFLYQDHFASGFLEGDDELQHNIAEYKEETLVKDYFVKTSEWVNKEDLTQEQGIYNILIPIMNGYVKSYMNK